MKKINIGFLASLGLCFVGWALVSHPVVAAIVILPGLLPFWFSQFRNRKVFFHRISLALACGWNVGWLVFAGLVYHDHGHDKQPGLTATILTVVSLYAVIGFSVVGGLLAILLKQPIKADTPEANE